MKALTEWPACVWLRDRAAEVPADQAVVEIGVFQGGSLRYLCSGADMGAGPLVVGIDPWGLDGAYPESAPGRFARYKEPSLQRVARRVNPTAKLVRGFSADVARDWAKPPVGLLFIDGNHAESMADFVAWERHLVSGAWVAFDDCDHIHPDIQHTVDVLFRAGRLVDGGMIGSRLAVGRRP